MTDSLDSTFKKLRENLGPQDRLSATHADPFFTFVHAPGQTLELHRRLPRWRTILREQDGFNVEIHSLRELAWDLIDASERWDAWLEAEEPSKVSAINRSMGDVLFSKSKSAAEAASSGLLGKVADLLHDGTTGRLVLLTDAALLHPWFRADKLGASLHDRIGCRTVLFYPGHRRGNWGLYFLGFYPEDGGSYRTTIVGGS